MAYSVVVGCWVLACAMVYAAFSTFGLLISHVLFLLSQRQGRSAGALTVHVTGLSQDVRGLEEEGTTLSIPSSVSEIPTRTFEWIVDHQPSFQSSCYNSLIKIGFTSASRTYYFSEDVAQDYVICSAVSVFNMAIAFQSMSSEQAAQMDANGSRCDRLKSLYILALELCSLLKLPEQQNDLSLQCTGRAVRDLIAMATLNNLVQLNVEHESHNAVDRNNYLIALLTIIHGNAHENHYQGAPGVTTKMAKLVDTFLISAFFVIKFIQSETAPAA
jgi:hypothetical protein